MSYLEKSVRLPLALVALALFLPLVPAQMTGICTTPAESVNLPACGLAMDPLLVITPPVIGSPVTISISSDFPNTLGWLYASQAPVVPMVVPGTGCTLYTDMQNPANFELFAHFTTDANGNWTITNGLALLPSQEGTQLIFQARLCDPNTPGPLTPDWVSNGVALTIGCEPCPTQATVSPPMASCNLADDPVLTATPPVIGSFSTIAVMSNFPNTFGWYFLSVGPVAPLVVDPTGMNPCTIYPDVLNPGNFLRAVSFVSDANGNFSLTVPIPASGIEGLELVIQCRMCAPTGPPGPLSPDWVSNGLVLTLGCF